MTLEIQLLSLIFSFAFGIILSYLYNISYNMLNHEKLKYKILINILMFLDMFLIYFILLKIINNGVIHLYFLLVLFLGFCLFVNKSINLRKLLKIYVKKSKANKK